MSPRNDAAHFGETWADPHENQKTQGVVMEIPAWMHLLCARSTPLIFSGVRYK